jgi:hypothetical protein
LNPPLKLLRTSEVTPAEFLAVHPSLTAALEGARKKIQSKARAEVAVLASNLGIILLDWCNERGITSIPWASPTDLVAPQQVTSRAHIAITAESRPATMTATIHSLRHDDHVIVVTLSARELMRISQALDESEDEYCEELGYSTMAKDFDRLFNHLDQEGYQTKSTSTAMKTNRGDARRNLTGKFKQPDYRNIPGNVSVQEIRSRGPGGRPGRTPRFQGRQVPEISRYLNFHTVAFRVARKFRTGGGLGAQRCLNSSRRPTRAICEGFVQRKTRWLGKPSR